jgi:hypothetical protein
MSFMLGLVAIICAYLVAARLEGAVERREATLAALFNPLRLFNIAWLLSRPGTRF